eukprot:5487917-Amphidinium_carterae.1
MVASEVKFTPTAAPRHCSGTAPTTSQMRASNMTRTTQAATTELAEVFRWFQPLWTHVRRGGRGQCRA